MIQVRARRYIGDVERTIMGFHEDDRGDHVAELACGHGQHVRHQPPFRLRPWIVDPGERAERIGATLDCPLCDRAERPEGLRFARSSPVWDEQTIPAGLRRSHRMAGGTWGELQVIEGRMRFVMASEPVLDVVVRTDSAQAIPPEVAHRVEPLGPVRFSITYFTTEVHADRDAPRGGPATDSRRGRPVPPQAEGGEPACWVAWTCAECGSVLDGSPHSQGCSRDAPP